MASKNRAKKKIHSLFQVPGNRENLELLYESLSRPSKGLCLCRALPEERSKILGFFAGGPVMDRIHNIDMVNPPLGPMELQQNIIDTNEKFGPGKDIFFIYNIEGSIRLLKTTADDFFQRMNLIRDFFMQFEAEFVFFVTEPLLKTIIRSAFDFYDWVKFTFTFVPESKDSFLQPIGPGEKEKATYSNPLEKIKYLKNAVKRVKNEKARSMQLLELAKLYFQVGDYDNALEQLNQSLAVEEKHEDFNNMAIRYHEIGLCHKARGDMDNALEFFSKAAKIFEENNDRDNMELARTNMDRVYQLRARSAGAYRFNWNELLDRIVFENVIPVIGPGLYRVELESKAESGVLLYDYLAGQVLKECGGTLTPDESHKFAKACLAFLKKTNNDYFQLADFLKETLKGVRLVPGGSLWKLARIKPFKIFITTAYDDFLANTIKTVRRIPTELRYYSLAEKKLDQLATDLFACIGYSQCTLVYHIFGNLGKTLEPAYTERDIMETLLEFQKDTIRQPENHLFLVLQSRSLLFMGSGFDDWLYRLFIRTISNEPYEFAGQRATRKYAADDFRNYKKDPFQELTRFLRDYDTEVFHTGSGSDFVDMLFDKLSEFYPEKIIRPHDFPAAAYISFEAGDRDAARRLATHLREDGIDVWLDERNFVGGDDVDQITIKAIDQCPVFIPLISLNSRRLLMGNEKLKYHIKEWEWAYSRMKRGNDLTILPVKIDDTGWTYDKFKSIYLLNIPGGRRGGDYGKLRNRLMKVQRRFRE